jgi:hypothetical protein
MDIYNMELQNQLKMYADTFKHQRLSEGTSLMKHQFSCYEYKNGVLIVQGENYQTRLRKSSHMV